MKRIAVWLLILALPAALSLTSCKGGSEQSNTFKIGVVTSLTGAAAAFGQAHKNGYTIGLADMNA